MFQRYISTCQPLLTGTEIDPYQIDHHTVSIKYQYCFGKIDKSQNQQISQQDRLFQLIVKGLLYESCVEYCQACATQTNENYDLNDPSILLMQTQLQESDASLLTWLHALSHDTFSCPFEEKSLKINMDRFIKPNLEATWADHILSNPIKPKQVFPYNALPTGRSRNTELMSRSLAPQYDGLSFGLNRSQIFNGFTEIEFQPVQPSNGTPTGNNRQSNRNIINDISRSVAMFNFSDTSSNGRQQATPMRPLNGIQEEDQHQYISTSNSTSSSSLSMRKMPDSPTNISANQMQPSKSNNKQPSNPLASPLTPKELKIKEAVYLENASMNDSSLFKVQLRIIMTCLLKTTKKKIFFCYFFLLQGIQKK
jgi:hypothetical protein